MQLSISDMKELLSGSKPHPYSFLIGKNVIIRTVTMIYIGKLIEVFDHELLLSDCSWIASTKRWADTLKNGELDEVEPYPEGDVVVGRGAIVDVSLWDHALPRIQK